MDTPRNTEQGVQPGEVRDTRIAPRGVLPRRMQTWIMAGLALVIVTVIVLTGHQTPPASPQTLAQTAQPASAAPERIRSFQREMGERGVRDVAPVVPQAAPPDAAEQGRAGGPPPVDQIAEEQRRREYQSVFADNVAFSRRAGGAARMAPAGAPMPPAFPVPSPQDLAAFQQSMLQSQTARGSALPPAGDLVARDAGMRASTPPVMTDRENQARAAAGDHRVLEGTFVETVLLNRLDGTFSGPVACVVTTPVYSEDRQTLLIPAGARVLGDVAPVQTWGDTRLAVRFHRLLLPNGDTVSLDQFKGLNQIGETGLADAVNRHYLQLFGASVAVGALSGLAQWQTRGGSSEGFGDAYRQSAGSSLATSTGRILDRYLNVLPTITIHEGHRIKVYLTNDLFLPAYVDGRGADRSRKDGAS